MKIQSSGPYFWHLKSSIVDHDHPYSRPSYLDPVTTLCLEPAIKECSNSQDSPPISYVDIEDDECENDFHADSFDKDDLSRFYSFCRTAPVNEIGGVIVPACRNTLGVSWNTLINRPYRRMRAFLTGIAVEVSISSNVLKYQFDFKRHSLRDIRTRRIARSIRKMFTSLNWRIDTCAELHEKLIETLPGKVLLLYLCGYACLMHHSKVSLLLRRLNSAIVRNLEIKRFDYARFVDVADRPPNDPTVSALSRFYRYEGLGASCIPVSFVPPESLISNSLCKANASSERSPSTSNEPIFLCAIPKSCSRSSRIGRILGNLSPLSRRSLLTISGSPAVRVRKIIRQFLVLLDDQYASPIYLVGFGVHCDVVLSAASSSQLLPPTASDGGVLADVLCGRLTSAEAPVPAKSWLAGVVLIAPPRSLLLLAPPLDQRFPSTVSLETLACRCSLLAVVGANMENEARAFRQRLLAAREKATALTVGGKVGEETGTPCEFDLRLLLIGGADHLLRMHPEVLKRFCTTQAAIDLAIVTAIRNLGVVCRSLVNPGVTAQGVSATASSRFQGASRPNVAAGTGNNGSRGSAVSLPQVWLNHNFPVGARRRMPVAESGDGAGSVAANLMRRASILRGAVGGGMQQRSYSVDQFDRFGVSRQAQGVYPAGGYNQSALIRFNTSEGVAAGGGFRRNYEHPNSPALTSRLTPRGNQCHRYMDREHLVKSAKNQQQRPGNHAPSRAFLHMSPQDNQMNGSGSRPP